MVIRPVIAWTWIVLSPVLALSQAPRFNADSVYASIEHLTVTIGPRPMGSLNERIALDWAAQKLRGFGADSVFIMEVKKIDRENSPVNTNSGVAVGVFRGETDSTIVIGGHIDSAGREIAGANDDASGAATVLELARIWSQRPRRYSMVFCTFGGEERGLVGSDYFVKHYRNIDNVVLMFSIDMTGSDDRIAVLMESGSFQAPAWLVKDAFALDRDLGIHRLQYPTHFSTINNLISGAGSDHQPFLNKKIPAIDFTAGLNNSPIHTQQDRIDFISKPMLDRYGRLVDGLLVKYQERGIPHSKGKRFMLWRPFGILLLIPPWLIVTFNISALLAGIGAFIHSRKNRLRIEKPQRIRFSGLKLFGMILVIAIFSQLGESFLQLFKGLRYPWLVHVQKYLWYAGIWSVAGLWVVLQITRKWRFSPDPYVYAKRALIFLLIFFIPAGVISMRLALYPGISLLLVSLAILIPIPPIRLLLSVISPLPMLRLMFFETIPLYARFYTQTGASIDTFWIALLLFTGITLALAVSYLPFIYAHAYASVSIPPFKSFIKWMRKPAFGLLILIIIIGYGGYLYSLPATNAMWRHAILVRAEYDISKQESKLELIGNEYFRDVVVKTDSLTKQYSEKTHKEELKQSFTADWLSIGGSETKMPGEKDTLAVRWRIKSSHPWHEVTLSVRADTLQIDSVRSDLKYRHRKDLLTFSWSADPPEILDVSARFAIHPKARLIRTVSAQYAELPIRMDISSEQADFVYRTVVVRRDTLSWEIQPSEKTE
ncbi:MAG: M28 family peptidase [bacterium]